MTDREALMATVLAHPELDAPRLIFADFLDEHAGMESCPGCDGDGFTASGHYDGGHGFVGPECDRCSGRGVVPDADADLAEFIRVGCELRHPVAWHPGGRAGEGRLGVLIHRRGKQWLGWYADDYPAVTFVWLRGFPNEVRAPLDWLVGRECDSCEGGRLNTYDDRAGTWKGCMNCGGTGGEEGNLTGLVRSWPLAKAVTTDVRPEPHHLSGGYRPPAWRATRLPEFLMGRMRESGTHHSESPGGPGSDLSYDTADEAVGDLSRALLAWAKGDGE